MKRLFPILFLLALCLTVKAQDTYQQRVQNYVNQYKEIAIDEMKRTGVPASITLAQGIIETDAGASPLVVDGNNHFGIKCHNEWNGATMYWDDDKKNECFRKYDNSNQSFKDHSDFLKTRPRYSCLFELDEDDYQGWSKGLKACGYATNPRYSDMLINTIEANNLQQFDLMGLDGNYVRNTSADSSKKVVCLPQDQDPDIDAIVSDVNADPKKGRVFYLNGIKTIEVKSGENLKKISKNYDISFKRLLKYNDLSEKSKVKAGDKIYLQPKRRNGNEAYHTVSSSETMLGIAQHGIQLSYLYLKNKMKPGTQPAEGEIIFLRSDRTSTPKLNTESVTTVTTGDTVNGNENKYYIVQKGDTLYSISKKYNTTVEQLKTLNQLSSDTLSIGDKLLVQ